jgi:hypothetical protein
LGGESHNGLLFTLESHYVGEQDNFADKEGGHTKDP